VSSGPSTVELLVRMVLSLALIVGLLWLGAKVVRRNGSGLRALGLPGGRRKGEPAIVVLDRQALTRNASVAVVQVGDRTMVVGITEHEVSLLADGAGVPGDGTVPAPARDTATELAIETDNDSITDLREAERTTPPPRPPRMSFVEALREITVRKP
jgi:flagellar protein FliO/FliZ